MKIFTEILKPINFMRIKNNATRKAVKTIILTFRLASSNNYQLKNGRRHKGSMLQSFSEK